MSSKSGALCGGGVESGRGDWPDGGRLRVTACRAPRQEIRDNNRCSSTASASCTAPPAPATAPQPCTSSAASSSACASSSRLLAGNFGPLENSIAGFSDRPDGNKHSSRTSTHLRKAAAPTASTASAPVGTPTTTFLCASTLDDYEWDAVMANHNHARLPGVDFSNVRRQNLYATPSKGPVFSPGGPSSTTTTLSPSRSPSRIPGSTSSAYTSSARRPYTPSGSNAGRKRSRLSTTTGIHTASPLKTTANNRPTTPSTRTSTFSPPPTASTLGEYATPGYVSPAPLANSHYTLADGFDTPTARAADAYDRPIYSAEAERARCFRRLRDDDLDRPTYDYGLDGMSDVAGPLARAQNGPNKLQDGFGTSDEDDLRVDPRTPRAGQAEAGSDPAQWSVSRALFSTVASAAGFVFHFCTAGAFKGFAAGGGQAWTEDGHTVPGHFKNPSHPNQPNANPSSTDPEADEDVFGSRSWLEDPWQDAELTRSELREATGPRFSYFEPTSSWPPPSPAASTPGTPPRAAKKVKTSRADDGGLKGNWIFVGSGDVGSRPASPSSASPAGLRRKTAGVGSVGGGVGSHLSTTGTPLAGRRRRFTATVSVPTVNGVSAGPGSPLARPASSAALRSPGLLRGTHTAANDTLVSRAARRSRAGSIRHSIAGTGHGGAMSPPTIRNSEFRHSQHPSKAIAANATTPAKATDSPIGREGQRLIRMKHRFDREEDKELMRMNMRLEEMIRQGKEALVTRYEVEMVGDEEMG